MVYYSLVACFHWSVPVFMAITGTLLLSKKKMNYVRVWKYFKRIAIVVIIFGTIYAWMELYFNTHQVSLALLIQGFLNMLKGNSWDHLWYLYMLLGIYLVLPIIIACKKTSKMNIVVFLSVYIFFTSLLPVLGIKEGCVQYPFQSIYIFYLVMGYVLMKDKVQQYIEWKANDRWIFTICILTFMVMKACVILSCYYEIEWLKRLYSYTSPVIIVQSLMIFYLITKQKNVFDKFVTIRLSID